MELPKIKNNNMANQTIKNKIKQKFVNMLFNGDERIQEDLKWNYCNLKKKGKKELRYLFVEGDDNLPSLTIHPIDEDGNHFAPAVTATSVYYMQIRKDPFGTFSIPSVDNVGYNRDNIVLGFGWSNLEDCFLTYVEDSQQSLVTGWLFDFTNNESNIKTEEPRKDIIIKKTRGAKVKFSIAVHRLIRKHYYEPHRKLSTILLNAGYKNEDGTPLRPSQINQIKNADRVGLFAKFKRKKNNKKE